jgi:F-type H+-transporting ATPase subunit delta
MAEITTVARPYAEAVFRLAREQGNLARWSELLIALAKLSRHPEVAAVIADPAVSDEQCLRLLPDLLGTKLSAEELNFLTLILQNRRFVALPEISELFEAQKSAAENQLDVQVETAFPLSSEQVNDLTAKLSQQLARKITAAITVNPDLIGGVKVTVGDLVIDASLRGKLSALATSLKS